MIFRQLFEPETSTYTYLLGDEETREAVLVDPVASMVDRDLEVLAEHGLTLQYVLETHVHADHVAADNELRERTGCRVGLPEQSGVDCADFRVREGEPIEVGSVRIEPLFTPGHTDDSHSYVVGDMVLTGDTLLIDGCGRTDFQNGDAEALFESVRNKLFALPEQTLVHPGHDYNHRHVSTIGQEKERNPRLGMDKSHDEFLAIMANLDLPYPKRIDEAVPANKQCGRKHAA
ncbi:Zn-dependent hydrolase [Thiohalorhabdus denitrificans]|uniref:Glyoxylase, beta-lactamase superfamily II n=1 Tax=Thiohalorhabdus denitrificans TaxID=381306 RepID=A0A0P9C4E1_9GAMM|nr:MBL fold metallo-hydrolase [Thiohalorhabdus denitrificans]KPV39663.1 Zn-dependent hydrolase [Thiohalorhabdus denitrificans]SCX94904.1 Glyoxylase, beta-lactamase superfamily II [Thiohalorhabdus denitrificans]